MKKYVKVVMDCVIVRKVILERPPQNRSTMRFSASFPSLPSITQTQIILICPSLKYTFIFLYLLTVFLCYAIIQSNIKIVPFKIPSIFLFSKSNFFLKKVSFFQVTLALVAEGLRACRKSIFVSKKGSKKYYIYNIESFWG